MKLKSKKLKIIILLLFIFIGLIIFFIWQNNAVGITSYKYINSEIPESFQGYKIVQISDLHNKDFDGRLSGKIEKTNPDIIVITGDLIDRRKMRLDIALEFVQKVVKIAPVYYVSGNHEQWSGAYETIIEELEKLNVQIIDNSYVILNQGGNEVGLLGLADPAAKQSEVEYPYSDRSYVEENLKILIKDIDTDFNILLSHRPEHFSIYKDMDVDLVFSGHAHGGQIRIPFIGGLVAPNQGIFPKYSEGNYSEGSTSMIVSRGLGNSIFPLRIFNRPEIVVVTLKRN